jgi:1,2-diacylglycerol 3-alpha-glucosyltransferase
MNILILNPILYTPLAKGGTVHKLPTIKHTMIYNYALGFIELGHKVTIVASEEYRPTESEKYECEIVFLPNIAKKYFSRFPNGFPILKGLYSFIKRRHDEFDLIVVSEILTQQAIVASLLAPEKTIIWQEMHHHAPHFKYIPSKIYHNIVVRLLIKNRVRVAARSQSARKFLAPYCNRLSQTTIDHGVNLNNFTFNSQKSKHFICIARLTKVKRVDKVIEKFARFTAKYNGSEYKLYIAGVGEDEQALRELAAKYGVKENVVFCGLLPHKELAELVNQSQAAFIYTMRDLNLVSIPECLACGTPILTTTVPLLSRYIVESGMGQAKDDWTEDDIQYIVEHNDEMIANCHKHRYELSSRYRAEKMISVLSEQI